MIIHENLFKRPKIKLPGNRLSIRTSGFTVIEIIFSVAISGILAASVVTTVFGHTQAVEAENANTSSEGNQKVNLLESSLTSSLNAVSLDYTDSSDLKTQAEFASAQTELKIVQTAMDMMMINSGLKTVAPTLATSDMSSFPMYNPLYPQFLREQHSQWSYQCNSKGEVSQIQTLSSENNN